eukprot:gene17508-biopygen15910
MDVTCLATHVPLQEPQVRPERAGSVRCGGSRPQNKNTRTNLRSNALVKLLRAEMAGLDRGARFPQIQCPIQRFASCKGSLWCNCGRDHTSIAGCARITRPPLRARRWACTAHRRRCSRRRCTPTGTPAPRAPRRAQ